MSDISINFNIDSYITFGLAIAYEFLRDPVQEAGGILKDCIHELRINLNKIFEKRNKIRNEKKLSQEDICNIDTKFGILWYQSAMLENNDILQETWAKLLVHAEDKNFKHEIKIAFIYIINSLTFIEIEILNHVLKSSNLEKLKNDIPKEISINRKEIQDKLNINNLSFEAALNNLERCQLFMPYDNEEDGFIKKDITALGIMFLQACIAK